MSLILFSTTKINSCLAGGSFTCTYSVIDTDLGTGCIKNDDITTKILNEKFVNVKFFNVKFGSSVRLIIRVYAIIVIA